MELVYKVHSSYSTTEEHPVEVAGVKTVAAVPVWKTELVPADGSAHGTIMVAHPDQEAMQKVFVAGKSVVVTFAAGE